MALSRHAGFFASLKRVEDRLALEEEQSPDTMPTASPLVFLDHPTAAATNSSGPALDFLTLTNQHQDPEAETDGGDHREEDDDDIERLMALLGLSPPQDVHGAGCDCSGADGFMATVVGVVGPKCDREKKRIDAWIHHFYHSGGGSREPARLAHLLLANAKADDGQAFPPAVKEFLDRDAPSLTFE